MAIFGPPIWCGSLDFQSGVQLSPFSNPPRPTVLRRRGQLGRRPPVPFQRPVSLANVSLVNVIPANANPNLARRHRRNLRLHLKHLHLKRLLRWCGSRPHSRPHSQPKASNPVSSGLVNWARRRFRTALSSQSPPSCPSLRRTGASRRNAR